MAAVPVRVVLPGPAILLIVGVVVCLLGVELGRVILLVRRRLRLFCAQRPRGRVLGFGAVVVLPTTAAPAVTAVRSPSTSAAAAAAACLGS